MCGIFGMVNGSQDKLKLLALLNQDRGTDSTGFYNGTDICKYIKKSSVALSYVPDSFFNSTYIFGHTRFSTHGEITKNNSHPYRIGNIVGAHNGVISNFEVLKEKYNLNYDVDSQIIFYYLANGLPLSDLYGSIAIWYTDKNKPGYLYLLRNNNSPLHYLRTEKAFYFSSDDADLAIAFAERYTVYEVESGQLYEVNLKTLEIIKTPYKMKGYYDYGVYSNGRCNYNSYRGTYLPSQNPIHGITDVMSQSDFSHTQFDEEFYCYECNALLMRNEVHRTAEGYFECKLCGFEVTEYGTSDDIKFTEIIEDETVPEDME